MPSLEGIEEVAPIRFSIVRSDFHVDYDPPSAIGNLCRVIKESKIARTSHH